MIVNRELINAVRELIIDRNMDIYEIASRLKISPHTVQMIVDMINQTLT
jgi:DNA-binding CsgD family transcriptional regulator